MGHKGKKYIEGISNMNLIKDAAVVCKELGYIGALEALTHSHFGSVLTFLQERTGVEIQFKADEVDCKGSEDFALKIFNFAAIHR